MNAVKQVNSGEEAAIVLGSVSLKRKAENTELSNSVDSRDEIPERGLQQVGRNDPSGVVGEGPTKKKKEDLSWQKRLQIFFLAGFSSQILTIHRTAGKGRDHLLFPLPLPPVHEHWGIYLPLSMWDDYHAFLIATLVITRLLLNEIYHLIELPLEWLIDDAMFVCLFTWWIEQGWI